MAAARTVISTVAMYGALLLLVRLGGQRSLVVLSGYEAACVIAAGAVVGRTALLTVPTLGTGVVALLTLFGVQLVLGWGRKHRVVRRLLDREPVLLMLGPDMRIEAMRRARVTEDEIRQRLRLAGIGDRADVGCVVLERNGQISVIRGALDESLFVDVPGIRGDRRSGPLDGPIG
ncbi:DUF421 domain-containing protein [Pseudonocardia saturnea]